ALPLPRPAERDVAEVLARRLGPFDRGDRRDEDAATPGALREPGDLAGRPAGLRGVLLAGFSKLLLQPLRPPPVREALDAGAGEEAGDRGAHGRHRPGTLPALDPQAQDPALIAAGFRVGGVQPAQPVEVAVTEIRRLDAIRAGLEQARHHRRLGEGAHELDVG